MARIIRFPLKMKNGAEIRTLDELKENFDLESVLGYFTDGKLATWLADRYYDEKAAAVSALSADMTDLNAKLCEILEVEYKAEGDEFNLEKIQRNNEKYKILCTITSDREILDNTDIVAMNQEELYGILDESPKTIYLYGDKFSIPFGAKNVQYIGINMPLVILENDKGVDIYEEAGIKFKNVKYESTINPYVTIGEKLFLEGKFEEAFPLIEQAANNSNPRAMYIINCYYKDGYNVVKIDLNERKQWAQKAYSYKEPLSMYLYASLCIENSSEEQNRIYSLVFSEIKRMAESNDILAQAILGEMYDYGYGVEQSKDSALEWYRKAADHNYAYAQGSLGYMYDSGQGVEQDKKIAFEWYKKSADLGNAYGQGNLGCMYENGWGVDKDYGLAEEWYLRAAEQAQLYAIKKLAYMYRKIDNTNIYDRQEVIQNIGRYHGKICDIDPDKERTCSWFFTSRFRDEALNWFCKGAELGDLTCKVEAGLVLCDTELSREKVLKAIEWLKDAVDYEPVRVCEKLGFIYQYGIHEGRSGNKPFLIEPDSSMAIDYYTKGANAGSSLCRRRIDYMNKPAKKSIFKKISW